MIPWLIVDITKFLWYTIVHSLKQFYTLMKGDMIMFYRYAYVPAPQPFYFQGTEAELNKKLKSAPNLCVINGSNGSYVIGDESATAAIRSVCPNKDNMRIRYNKTRITKNDYIRLTDELNNGIISFDSLL